MDYYERTSSIGSLLNYPNGNYKPIVRPALHLARNIKPHPRRSIGFYLIDISVIYLFRLPPVACDDNDFSRLLLRRLDAWRAFIAVCAND